MSRVHRSQKFHPPRTSQPSEFRYQRALPQFNLNTRVKLPPIVKNEFNVSRGRTNKESSLSRPNLNTQYNGVFPRIIEATSKTSNGPANQTNNKHTNAKPGTAGHVQATPIHLPKVYTVLPPIGQSRLRPAYAGLAQAQTTERKTAQSTTELQNKTKGRPRRTSQKQRASTDLQDNDPSQKSKQPRSKGKSPGIENTSPAKHRKTKVKAGVSTREDNSAPSDTLIPLRKSNEEINNELPSSLCNEGKLTPDVETTEYEAINLLEKLELSKEAEEFLASEHSARRRAICTELDSSLKKAADIIRDILLRQTMEELCMMW